MQEAEDPRVRVAKSVRRPIDRQATLRLKRTITSVAHESDRDRTNYVVHSSAYIITCVFIVTGILNVHRKNGISSAGTLRYITQRMAEDAVSFAPQ
jgi:hypothetical protein